MSEVRWRPLLLGLCIFAFAEHDATFWMQADRVAAIPGLGFSGVPGSVAN